MASSSTGIRNLLLDCRTALRKADRAFEDSRLRAQLDEQIIQLGAARDRQQQAQHDAALPPAAQRVAYAWQSVARELRHTHPALYEELSLRVLQRLDTTVLDDGSDEIAALQDTLREREAAMAKVMGELSALRSALASAVPLAETVGGSESELAQQRLQALLQAVSTGGGLRREPAAPDHGGAPTRTTLEAVSEGQRPLTNHEREWCIGEAMVLTGFQQTPVQLLAQGDGALARLVLEGKPSP